MIEPRVLVLGGRDYRSRLTVVSALNDVYSQYGRFILITEGYAVESPAQMARDWFYKYGERYCIYLESYLPQWESDPIKSHRDHQRRVVKSGIDLTLAFPVEKEDPHIVDMLGMLQGRKVPIRRYDPCMLGKYVKV